VSSELKIADKAFIDREEAPPEGYPAIAYHRTRDAYLVVWRDGSAQYGRFLQGDGRLAGDQFDLNFCGSEEPLGCWRWRPAIDTPAVATRDESDEFMVVYATRDILHDESRLGSVIFGGDRLCVIADLAPASDVGSVDVPSVEAAISYSPRDRKFLVVWEVNYAIPNQTDIHGTVMHALHGPMSCW